MEEKSRGSEYTGYSERDTGSFSLERENRVVEG